MINGKKIVVVLPAFKAEKTLEKTYNDIPHDIVDHIILVDDASDDGTIEVAKRLEIGTFVHERNFGYGANQKTCYREALKLDADVVVMLHPDYQYEPKLVTAMSAMLSTGVYDIALGSRILGTSPLKGGMPIYKYISNRFLTFFQNLMLGAKISEYHTGYRAFNKKCLEELPILNNSDDFVFDNQMLTQAVAFDFKIGEISCPTKYFPDASSINFRRSVIYGIGVLITSVKYRLWKWGFVKSRLFDKSSTSQLDKEYYKSHIDVEK
nr:glycosyltransferase family 2 protein [uncultured Desulfobacter sp.]